MKQRYEDAPAAADTTTMLDTSSPSSSAASPGSSSTTTITVSYTASDGSGAGLDKVELWVRLRPRWTLPRMCSRCFGKTAWVVMGR